MDDFQRRLKIIFQFGELDLSHEEKKFDKFLVKLSENQLRPLGTC